MTVAAYEASTGEVAQYNGSAIRSTTADLIEWAQAADAAHRVAVMLCKTSFVPEEFRGKPAETAAAILAGNEVNFSPMASLNAFHIIKGRAAPNALALRAICQSVGHEFDLVESTEQRAVMKARRYGTDLWQTVTWTIQRAQRLDYLKRDQWRKQPQAMLVARVTSEAARLVGADAIMGIPYSYEELMDDAGVDGTAEGTVPSTPASTRRRRATAPRQAALAPSSPVPAADRPAGPAGRPPLPGEDTAAQEAPPDPPAADPVDYEAEAATARGAMEEHFDEAFGAPKDVADTTPDAEPTRGRPEDDEAYDPTEPDPAEPPAEAAPEPPATTTKPPDMKRLFALLRDAEVGDRHAYASAVLKRQITSYSQLTATDVSALVDNLQDIVTDDTGEEEGP